MNKVKIDCYLKQNADILIKYSSFISNIGLFNGKMGIAIFLYRYANYTKEKSYELYANELLDEIIDDLHAGMPVRIEDGLCGIRLGIEYLLKKKYINIDSNDLYVELDHFIENYELDDICERGAFAKGMYWVLLKNQDLNSHEFSNILDKLISELLKVNCEGTSLFPKMIQSLLFIVWSCLQNEIQIEKIKSIFNELSIIIENKLFFEDFDGSVYMMFLLYKKISQLELFEKENNNNLPEHIPAFSDVLFVSKYILITDLDISGTPDMFENKLVQIINDKDLIDELFYLTNINNLSLDHCLTGLGWSLLEYVDKCE
ncbi:MAG: hypothetical protein LBU57_09215 [Dysgonamonadaceae bacterium]|jgi:hypothetical protein|nr:hypothetical protein [Dysgonamonadaceae bacterium]